MNGFSGLKFTLSAALILSAIVFCTACSKKAESGATQAPSSGDSLRGPADAVPIPIESKSFSEKTPELARLAILQISHTLESFEFALSNQVDNRIVMPQESAAINSGQGILNYGCRTMRKFSPSYERTYDTNVERLRVTYVKCAAEDFATDQATSSSLRGEQQIVIFYDKPYPRVSAPELVLGYATSVEIASAPLVVDFDLKSGAHLKIRRESTMTADRLEDSETSSTYLIKAEITDSFEQFNNGISVRRGKTQIEVDDFRFQVGKSPPRKVIEISGGQLILKITGEKAYDPSQPREFGSGGSNLNNNVPISYELALSVDGPLGLPPSVCVPPGGIFQVGKINTRIHSESRAQEDLIVPPKVVTVASKGGGVTVTVDAGPSLTAEICNQPDDVFYGEEFQSAYR